MALNHTRPLTAAPHLRTNELNATACVTIWSSFDSHNCSYMSSGRCQSSVVGNTIWLAPLLSVQDERDFLEIHRSGTGNPARYFRCVYLKRLNLVVYDLQT